MMNQKRYLLRQGALEQCSLLSEGWIYVGRFNDADRDIVTLRHPNGNRAKIIVTPRYWELYINHELVKGETFDESR